MADEPGDAPPAEERARAATAAGRTALAARPTLADVAERAGVSLKTASRAVNGEDHVRDDTRARVLEAASALGFRLNSSASLLARGVVSDFVGVITGDLANPFYAALAQGAASELGRHGISVTLSSSEEMAEAESTLLAELVRRSVRGVIAASAMPDQSEYLALQRRGIPVVFVDRAPHGVDADAVVLDNAGGGREAARHLLASGHRRVAFLGDYGRLPTYRERRDGFGEAMTDAGVAGWARLAREGAHDPDTAARVAGELLDGDEPPTAFFASNNRATLGVLRELSRRGDTATALVGFDDFELADVLGVTVVAHDPRAMGAAAARMVVDRVGGSREAPRSTVLGTRIVARGSGERPAG